MRFASQITGHIQLTLNFKITKVLLGHWDYWTTCECTRHHQKVVWILRQIKADLILDFWNFISALGIRRVEIDGFTHCESVTSEVLKTIKCPKVFRNIVAHNTKHTHMCMRDIMPFLQTSIYSYEFWLWWWSRRDISKSRAVRPSGMEQKWSFLKV